MALKINEELKALIPPLSPDEYNLLEQSIINEGCRDKLITWDDVIVDGHNRYEICTKHNIPFQVEDRDFENEQDVKVWMITNQFGRRNINNYQRSILALELEEVYRNKAKERQRGGQGGILLSQKSDEAKEFSTKKELAKLAHVSHDTIAKVKAIEEKAPEQVKQQLQAGDVSINQAYKEIKQEEKKEERLKLIEETKQKIEQENIKIEGLFDVIAIDPPWAYEEKGGFTSKEYDANSNRGSVDYPTMTVSEISNINLPAKDNCVLYLWTTHAFLKDSFDLLDNWGFNYKATIVWDKEKIGIGRNIRMQCEFCLLATKGKPLIQGSSERDIIREPRREHSRKPDAFYEMVNRMCIGRKLDYFAREKREGWEVYGAETEKF